MTSVGSVKLLARPFVERALREKRFSSRSYLKSFWAGLRDRQQRLPALVQLHVDKAE